VAQKNLRSKLYSRKARKNKKTRKKVVQAKNWATEKNSMKNIKTSFLNLHDYYLTSLLNAATKIAGLQFKLISKWIAPCGKTVAIPSSKSCPMNLA
jgi:L-lactate utilization protein LutB